MCVGTKSSKGRGKYRSSNTLIFGVLAWIAACDFIGAFFRHFQMQKVNIKINRMKPKIERLLFSVFSFSETACTFIRNH